MKNFTIFQLCKTADDYEIYYNYKKDKLYGCYTVKEEATPNYWILLVQPLLIFSLEYLGKWMSGWESWGKRMVWLLILGLTTLVIKLFWMSWIEKTDEIRSRRLRELPQPEKSEWLEYLQIGEVQLKKRSCLLIWMGLGIVGSALLFLVNGFLLFLLLYMLLYMIAYIFAVVENPVRKYKFIKSRRNPNL